ncbi:MAG: hypothetical protein NZ602_06855 [Thermoguttaceae bacterium]|nr:hypothetical protein [Thermoguttaceae bacterium]MDW8038519.1 hypothetical protein [Thermoguttaceae bacterium]
MAKVELGKPLSEGLKHTKTEAKPTSMGKPSPECGQLFNSDC